MTESPSAEHGAKRPRVLACRRCHRRKIKCTRTFPCPNCIEAGSPCVQAAPQKTKSQRRVPERDAVGQLQRYEALLRKNNVAFEPINGDVPTPSSPVRDGPDQDDQSILERTKPPPSNKLNIWHSTDHHSEENDDDEVGNGTADQSFSAGNFTNDQTMQKALDHLYRDKNDHLLFFAPNPQFDLAAQHPAQAQLFKLWQIYQDNIDPLLKVTHTSSLQARIIDAIGDMDKIEASFAALLFSIYSIALVSLTESACSAIFGSASARTDLTNKFQVACQQALLRCGYLRSDDRDCLTALYLYMISIKPSVDRRSLCSMLGSVFRIAQRMEIHNESKNAKRGVFEAEMRRRLWWSLVIFDAHVCEMSNNLQSTNLTPTWDCKPPSNINDSDLRQGMKSLPPLSTVPTQALYIVARSAISQYLRHSDFQLAFINPSLNLLIRRAQTDALPMSTDEIAVVEKLLKINLSQHLDPDNPLHCITLWIARGQISKTRLLHHYWTQSRSKSEQSDTDRDSATSHALRILECEAHLTNLSHIRGFLWHVSRFYFPAYVHILKDLKARPTQTCAERAWEIMSSNFHARVEENSSSSNPVIRLFANLVLQAWEARERAGAADASFLSVPGIVSDVRRFVMQPDVDAQFDAAMDFNLDDFLPVPMAFSDLYWNDGAGSTMHMSDFNLGFHGP